MVRKEVYIHEQLLTVLNLLPWRDDVCVHSKTDVSLIFLKNVGNCYLFTNPDIVFIMSRRKSGFFVSIDLFSYF